LTTGVQTAGPRAGLEDPQGTGGGREALTIAPPRQCPQSPTSCTPRRLRVLSTRVDGVYEEKDLAVCGGLLTLPDVPGSGSSEAAELPRGGARLGGLRQIFLAPHGAADPERLPSTPSALTVAGDKNKLFPAV